MSAKEFGDWDPETWEAHCNPKRKESDPDLDREELEKLQPAAFQAAVDAECFDEVLPVYEGELLADCAAVSLGDTLRQIAVNAYVETRSKPRPLWSAWNEMHGDGKAQAKLDRLGYVDYYPGAKR